MLLLLSIVLLLLLALSRFYIENFLKFYPTHACFVVVSCVMAFPPVQSTVLPKLSYSQLLLHVASVSSYWCIRIFDTIIIIMVRF